MLVLRDRALRTLAKRTLYQQTLENILTLVAERNLIFFYNTQMITALSFQRTAHYMFGVQHHRGNTLMAAFMHRFPKYSGQPVPPTSARKPMLQTSPSFWIGSDATGWRRSWLSCIFMSPFSYDEVWTENVIPTSIKQCTCEPSAPRKNRLSGCLVKRET